MAPAVTQPPHPPPPLPKAAPSAAALSFLIARGDPAALAAFYESRFDALFVLARSFTGRDESFCLDVIQETMLRIARRMKPMATDADVDRWTASVLRNAATDLVRRERRRTKRDAGVVAVRRPITIATEAAEPSALRAALASLSADDALLLKLRFEHDATLDEAGRAVNTTGGAAHGRIRRALASLRTLLSEAAL